MSIAFADFYRAVPEARAIYSEYQNMHVDELFEHSKWLGRWVKRAEKETAQTALEPDHVKQGITDKLIHKLVDEILISPYDRAPFVPKTEKCPVLFKGLLFPRWMLEDIMRMIGMPEALRDAIPHELMNAMLDWSNSLLQRSPTSPMISGTLMSLNQAASPKYLDGTLLSTLTFSIQPELTIVKLLAYRDLIKKAFRELELRTMNKGARRQLKQIVQFSDEQKRIAEAEKTQIAQERVVHEQAVNRQMEENAQTQQSALKMMRENYQSLIAQMNQTEQRMNTLQQECKNKEAQIQALVAAQRNLKK